MNSGAPQQSTRQPRKRTKGVLKKLQEQIEFYFGDANLPKDKFLQQKISENHDGYVKVEVITSFNKVKSLTTDVSLVVRAMKNSSLLEVSEDQLWVRRSTPLPETSDVDLKTIYVENLPVNTTDHDMIKKLFKMFGSVTYVSLPKHKVSGAIKGFAFVEFSTQKEAETAVEYFQCKSGIETPKGGRKRSTTVADQTPGKDSQKSSIKEERREEEGKEDEERKKEEERVERGMEEEGMEEEGKEREEKEREEKEREEKEREEKEREENEREEKEREEKEREEGKVEGEDEREEEEDEQKGNSMKRKRKRGDSDGAQGDDDHVNTEPTAKRHRAEEAEGGEPDDGGNINQLVPAASREKQLSAEEGGGEGRSSGGEKSEMHEEVAEDSMRAMSRKRKREEEEEKDKEQEVLQEPLPPTKCADLESKRDGGVRGGEVVEGGGGKGKKRNRQHKRKDWNAVLNALNLRVFAKTEWLEMKAMYRGLQKEHIKQLKAEPQHRPGGEGNKQMGFVSQCLVRVKCEGEEVVTCRQLKEVCSKYGEVAFVDTREEGKEYFVRYRTSGCVPGLIENGHLPGVTFTSMEEEEERAYYLETQAARKQQKKLKGRGKMKKRGQDKVISKALKMREVGGVQVSHIRFSEDSDTED